MPPITKEIGLTIILGTMLILFFMVTMLFLFFIFKKKSVSFRQEKKLMQLTYSQTLLQSQLEIQEHTFNYISQEIHDNVGQVLSLAKVQANIMGENGSIGSELLVCLKENIDKALTDLRDIAKSLSSERIMEIGLYEAVATEAERITKSGIMQVTCSLEGQARGIEGQKKLILFRIVQEGLQNSIKHSGASEVRLMFDYRPEGLRATICDNGKGFDLEQALRQKNGLGLRNIVTRASLAGGYSNIKSIPEKGTTIKIDMAYE